MDLRFNTVATLTFGPFIGLDGLTPTTGLSVPTGRQIYGGTSSSYTPGTWTEIGDGYYSGTITPSAAGPLRIEFAKAATYLSTWSDYNVRSGAAYDMLTAAVASGGMSAVSAAGNLPVPGTAQTGDSFARIGAAGVGLTSVALSSAGVIALLNSGLATETTADAIKAQTDLIGTNGANSPAINNLAASLPIDPVTGLAMTTTASRALFGGPVLTADNFSIQLDPSGNPSAAPNDYIGCLVQITAGTGSGATLYPVVGYVASVQTLQFFASIPTPPDNTSTVQIYSTASYAQLAAVQPNYAPAKPADILATPGQPIATDTSGNVSLTSAAVTAIQTGLATPTNITAATGVILAPTGLDSISITAPTGPAATFREMAVQLWRRFFKVSKIDKTAGTLKTFADDGTTVVTTQTVSSTAGLSDESQGAAS